MKKVLLLRLSSLGDVVLTSSLIEPLIKRGFKPYLLTYEPYTDLFGDDPRIETIGVQKEQLKNLFRFFRLIEKLQKENFRALLDLHGNLKTFLLRRFLKVPLKAVYKKRALKRRLCVFLNRFGLAKGWKEENYSVLEAYGQTLRVLGIKEPLYLPKIEISQKRAQSLFKKWGLRQGEYIVLGIGARYRKKEYPHFGELARILSRNYRVVLVGDKRDYQRSKGWKGVLNLCGKLTLRESLYILSGAKLYVGNDSGATHMARSVKAPVLVIYGGTHPCLGFAPTLPEGKVITKNLPCSPCDIHGKGGCKYNYRCLDIPPQQIAEEVFKMVSQ